MPRGKGTAVALFMVRMLLDEKRKLYMCFVHVIDALCNCWVQRTINHGAAAYVASDITRQLIVRKILPAQVVCALDILHECLTSFVMFLFYFFILIIRCCLHEPMNVISVPFLIDSFCIVHLLGAVVTTTPATTVSCLQVNYLLFLEHFGDPVGSLPGLIFLIVCLIWN